MFQFLKHILALIVLLIILNQSFSQTYTGNFPAIGTNFIMAKASVFPGKKIGIRDLGGEICDLSPYLPESFDTIRLMEPLKTRYGRRFPAANIAMVISPVQIEYLIIDSGKVYLNGLIGDFMENKLPVLLQFNDTLLYKNPYLSLDQQYSDTSATSFLSPYYNHPATDSIKAEITYIRTGRVDASGELITPLGKYMVEREVIFIEKKVRGSKYTVFGWTPAPEYSLDKHFTLYRWYTKDLCIPIAEAFLNNDDYVEYVKYQYDSPLRLNFTGEHVKCKGGTDGSIQLTAKGGIPDYKYEWTNGATSSNLTDLKAGTYGVVVTDNRGRKISSFYTITEPHFALKPNLEVNHVTCKGLKNGKLKLNISGGTAPFDFKWSNDSVNETISNLAPGKIYYMISDAGGCFINDSVEITEPEEKLSIDFEEKQVSCYHGNDGSATAYLNGGTSPYHFVWADGDTSRIKTNMKAGQYSVTGYDKNGCSIVGSVTIKEPDSPLKISEKINPVNCFGGYDGSIELTVSGGKAPYQYLWPDSSDRKSLKGISSGIYKYSLTDKNGCQHTDSVFVPEPKQALQIEAIKKDVDCFGEKTGEIKLLVSGGSPDYQYSWSDGYNKAQRDKLAEGVYLIKITDKNQCKLSDTIEILSPEKPLMADFEKFDVKCKNGNDGAISLTVEGGTPDYNYLWSNKSIQKDLSGLKAGIYSVTISDKNQCKLKKEFEITEPAKTIEIVAQKTDIDCFNEKTGAIYLEIKGGKAPYETEWSNGSNSPNIIGIAAGKYTVTVVDALNCESIKIVEVFEAEKLTVKANITHPDKDMENGSINIEISGGNKPYSILWEDGQSGNLIQNLKAGKIELEIVDSKDCKISERFELIEK